MPAAFQFGKQVQYLNLLRELTLHLFALALVLLLLALPGVIRNRVRGPGAMGMKGSHQIASLIEEKMNLRVDVICPKSTRHVPSPHFRPVCTSMKGNATWPGSVD